MKENEVAHTLESNLTGDYSGRVYVLREDGKAVKSWCVPLGWGQPEREARERKARAEMREYLEARGLGGLLA